MCLKTPTPLREDKEAGGTRRERRERDRMERGTVHQSTGAQMGYCAHGRLKCSGDSKCEGVLFLTRGSDRCGKLASVCFPPQIEGRSVSQYADLLRSCLSCDCLIGEQFNVLFIRFSQRITPSLINDG